MIVLKLDRQPRSLLFRNEQRSPMCGLPGNDSCLATSMGTLIFTTNIERGDGQFTATVEEVPEPSLLLLMGGGVVALVRRSRRSGRA